MCPSLKRWCSFLRSEPRTRSLCPYRLSLSVDRYRHSYNMTLRCSFQTQETLGTLTTRCQPLPVQEKTQLCSLKICSPSPLHLTPPPIKPLGLLYWLKTVSPLNDFPVWPHSLFTAVTPFLVPSTPVPRRQSIYRDSLDAVFLLTWSFIHLSLN